MLSDAVRSTEAHPLGTCFRNVSLRMGKKSYFFFFVLTLSGCDYLSLCEDAGLCSLGFWVQVPFPSWRVEEGGSGDEWCCFSYTS